MAYINGNKPIITNGLVYALDFGNTKSYNSGSNTARSMVFDPAGTTVVTGSTAIPVLTNGVLNFTGSQFVRRTGSIDTFASGSAFTVQVVGKANTTGNLFSINTPVGNLSTSITPSSSLFGFNLASGPFSRNYPGFTSSSLQHITYRYSQGTVDIFVNGIPVTASAANSAITTTTISNALFINSGSNFFSGSVAQFYVYNRALTPDEIYENYLVSAGRNNLPVIPKPYSIDENLYQWIQATNTTDTNTISAISTFISGLKSNGLWNKLQTIYPFVGTTTGSQTINLKEPGIYRLGLTGSFSASNAGLYPSSSTSYVDSMPGNTVHPLVNSASAHLSLLSYDTPAGNGFLGGNSLPALGGEIIARSGSKVYHAFTTVGTSSFTPLTNAISNVEVMVVAGGGGGGSLGGGGGAGGLIYSSSFAITPGLPVQVVVGNGGAGGSQGVPGSNGENSSFSSIQSLGGGGAGSYAGLGGTPGQNGGSGGGGGATESGLSTVGGSGSIGQGNNGGAGGFYPSTGGGGGGGAGQAGQAGGIGGSGSYYPQFDLLGGFPAGWFAGGGNGVKGTTQLASAPGGGGASTIYPPTGIIGKDAVANTGGGGGNGSYLAAGGRGGSGIVIIGYDVSSISATTGSGTGLYLTDSGITGSVNSQFTAGITGSGTIGFLTVSRTGSGVFSIHKNNVSQSIASASLGALPTDIFFNTANLAGSGSLPLPVTLAYASIGAGLTTSEVATYYNLVSQFQTNLKRQNTLLDNYSGAAAAYSLRRIGPSGYFGPAIRVRRDSDNTLRDIGFTSDGQLDTVGLLDFVGVTGSGFVQTWYDQSGNNNHGIQTTLTRQPLIINSGSVFVEGINPALRVIRSNSNSLIVTSPGLTIRSTFTVGYAYNPSLGDEQHFWRSEQSGIPYVRHTRTSRQIEWNLNTLRVNSVFPTPNKNRLMTGIANDSYLEGFLDGNSLGSDSIGTALSTVTNLGLGGRPAEGIDGILQEILIYPDDQGNNKTAIESNINSNYKIYGDTTASFDPDYQAFITATGITEPTQSAALETLVSDLKSYGLWSKMKAIYPMVTDRNNRFAQSEDFSSTWNAESASVAPNQTTAPNGTLTADLILDTVDTGEHYIYQTIDGDTGIVTGSEYVLSTYAKFYNTPYIAFKTNTGAQAWFDVQTGVTGSYTGSNATITNVGNGWYRCALYFTSSVATGPYNQQIHLALTDNDLTFAGTGTSGSYLWGAQFENGNLLGPYRKTEGSGFAVSGSNSMLDQMKFNLKNSADTDAAFRLTYSGSWNPGYSGVRGNGVSGTYANTKLNPSSSLELNSAHLSFYSRTDNDQGGVDIGTQNLTIQLYLGTLYYRINQTTYGNLGPYPSNGYFLGSRNTSTEERMYKNNSLVNVGSRVSSILDNTTINLGSWNESSTPNGNTPSFPTNREYAFTTLGDGLTDYEAKALYWIVQKFQTTLGRQVY